MNAELGKNGFTFKVSYVYLCRTSLYNVIVVPFISNWQKTLTSTLMTSDWAEENGWAYFQPFIFTSYSSSSWKLQLRH